MSPGIIGYHHYSNFIDIALCLIVYVDLQPTDFLNYYLCRALLMLSGRFLLLERRLLVCLL